jgi:hypothetical protein
MVLVLVEGTVRDWYHMIPQVLSGRTHLSIKLTHQTCYTEVLSCD